LREGFHAKSATGEDILMRSGFIKQGNGLLYLSGYFFTRLTQAGENKVWCKGFLFMLYEESASSIGMNPGRG
jgi:hypothetical protein